MLPSSSTPPLILFNMVNNCMPEGIYLKKKKIVNDNFPLSLKAKIQNGHKFEHPQLGSLPLTNTLDTHTWFLGCLYSCPSVAMALCLLTSWSNYQQAIGAKHWSLAMGSMHNTEHSLSCKKSCYPRKYLSSGCACFHIYLDKSIQIIFYWLKPKTHGHSRYFLHEKTELEKNPR